MALSTNEAPIYGGSTLVIEFPEDAPLVRDASYYLVYEGSQKRHVTTARPFAQNKLHSIIPGHNEAEPVQLSILCYHGDTKRLLATSPFHFHNDGAFFLAQFLVDSVYNPAALEDLELVKSDHFDLANEDLATLDQRLSRALAYLDFPDWWSLLGADSEDADPKPRESLLHFAARLGLTRVAGFLIGKPGSKIALKLPNRDGILPSDLSLACGYPGLKELLSEYNAQGFMPLGRWFETDKGVVQTQETGDVTLTSKLEGHNRTIEEDIEILNNVQHQGAGGQGSNLRQWQTDWPSKQQQQTEVDDDLPGKIGLKIESMYQQAHEIQTLITGDAHYTDDTSHDKLQCDLDLSPHVPIADLTSEADQIPPDYENIDDPDTSSVLSPLNDGEIPHLTDTNTELPILTDTSTDLHFSSDTSSHLPPLSETSTQLPPSTNSETALFDTELAPLSNTSELPPSTITESSALQDTDLVPLPNSSDLSPSQDVAENGEVEEDASYEIDVDQQPQAEAIDADQQPDIEATNTDQQLFTEGIDSDQQPFTEAIDGNHQPEIHMSEEDFEVEAMEDSVSTLHGYNEHLLRIREKSVVFNRILEQDLRKDQLARFSSSCPALDVDRRDSPLPVIDEADHSRSMLDLAEGDETTGSVVSEDLFSSGNDLDTADTCNGINADNNEGFGVQSQEYDEFLTEYYGGNIPQVRQRSPASTTAGDTATQVLPRSPDTPQHSAKGLTGSEADVDTDEDESFHRQEMLSTSPSAGKDGPRRNVLSTGDIDAIQRENDKLDGKQEKSPSYEALKTTPKSATSGRGQNKSRFSANIEQMDRPAKKQSSSGSLDAQYGSSQPASGESTEDEVGALNVPAHIKMTKALSTSSIPAATKAEKRDGKSQGNISREAAAKKEKEKEDKKSRKIGVFSRFHSNYRTKKNKDKENMNKSGHKFVSVSFSNATACDACQKPLINKQAFRCEYCLLNVHESTCKDQITQCDKFREKNRPHAPRQLSADIDASTTSSERPSSTIGVSNLRPSYSFKEKTTRPITTFSSSTTQPIPVPGSPVPDPAQGQSTSDKIHRRSLPTPNHPIAEEGEQDVSGRPGLDLGHSNITETSSQSIESLDEVDTGVQEVGYDDQELRLLDTVEPETWSETVDKKTLKKLGAKDIKCQNTIWELIVTERYYCKSLKTLQILFRDGLLEELNMSPAWVERLFPQLDELISIHMTFLQQLYDLQKRRPDRSVVEIGPTLKAQFSGDSANQMKAAYGVFCSGHLEAVQIYKDQYAKDRKFQSFIKNRQHHHLCLKREIPGFILLITQRPTKYPILIEAVLKSTKDKKERECLVQALELSKDVLMSVDGQVKSAELQMRLKDIYQRLDGRSFAIHRGKKFKKLDILANRKLLHEGRIGWKNARGKATDVIALVLTDVLLFLQENNQKYSFYSQDNKFGVIPLFNLLVREKGETRNTKGLYLISQNKENPEMYEVVCATASDFKVWAEALRSAVEACPEEEEEIVPEADMERQRAEERFARALKIMDKLHEKDEEIRACCDAKNKLLLELSAVYNDTEDQQHGSRPNSHDFDDTFSENSGTLQAAIQEVSNAASQLTSMLHSGTSLSRSVSSVGEHASGTYPSVLVPRRAETFAGFDSQYSLPKVPVKKKGVDQGDFTESPQQSLYKDADDSDSDLTQYSDAPVPAYQRTDMSEADSGRGSSPGAFSSVSTLSPMSALSATQEQLSVAHLLQTLNSIVHLTASQGTAVETLRAQLSKANERINSLSIEVHERKSGYKHNQLEELRNLQGIVQKEKMDWEREKEREYERMEEERAQLEELRQTLEQQQAEIKTQKIDLRKQREVLQRQTEMLRQQGMLPRDSSFSQLNTSPGYSSDSERESHSKDIADTGNVQSNGEFTRGHRRSASAESFKKLVTPTSDSPGKSSPKDNQRSDARPNISKLNSFSYGNKQMPVHLLSATNEQKIGSKKVQQLPSKLLANSNTSSPAVTSAPNTVTQPGGVKSAAAAINAGLHHTASGSPIGSHGNISILSPGHESGSNSDSSVSHIGHSASSGHVSMHSSGQTGHYGNHQGQTSNVGSSVTVPMGNRQSNRQKQSPAGATTGLSGVMKLAQKGDKKGKSLSTSQLGDKGAHDDLKPPSGPRPGQRNPNINHKPQKSDSDVIYF